LRVVEPDDVEVFFQQQLDPVANQMVAFTGADPTDRGQFEEKWSRIVRDPDVTSRAVLVDGAAAGYVLVFDQSGKPSVAYWIGRSFWGRGVASAALAQLLDIVEERPLYARAAVYNSGSIRVLEKCGFTEWGRNRDFANARGEDVEEILFRLDGEASGP
jgi:RimJ/RimL family protein N-acetyltransferase